MSIGIFLFTCTMTRLSGMLYTPNPKNNNLNIIKTTNIGNKGYQFVYTWAIMRELRLVCFGSSDTGKSQLISRFMGRPFSDEYEPTIEERYTKEACIDGRYTSLKILDTQGLEQFRAMREIYINNADAIILLYDTMKETSVNELEDLAQQIINTKSQTMPLVIVGTKSDQLTRSSPSYVLRMGERLAARLGKPHVLTSAKHGQHITEVFGAAINECRKNLLANRRSNNSDSNSTLSISSIDGWLYTPSERMKATPQPTLKTSFLKLKKSVAQLKKSKSIRNIRKAVSSASFYRSSNHASHPAAKASTSADTLRAAPRNAQENGFRGGNSRIAQQAELEDNALDPAIETVTQNQLESVLEFDDVDDVKLPESRGRGICSIM